jgi:hypothetical protein
MKDTLPDKLSELLRLAVHDCIRAEAQGQQLDMRSWYQRGDSGCTVCMAGAVLLYEVKLDPGEELPSNLRGISALRAGVAPSVVGKMLAINDLRVGDIFEALANLDDAPVTAEQIRVCSALESRWSERFCHNDDCCHVVEDSFCVEDGCSCRNECDGLDLSSGRLGWDQYLEIADTLEGVGL